MRVLFSFALALILLGGTYAYIRFAASIEVAPKETKVAFADQIYSLEVSRTFTAVPETNSAAESTFPTLGPESIRVLLKARPLIVRSDEVSASEKLFVQSIPDVEDGVNEIFVFARHEPLAEGELAAMKVRVLCDRRVVAETTFTNHPGSSIIYGAIVFEAGEKNDR